MSPTTTSGGAVSPPTAGEPLELVSLHWERIQIVIRARRGGRALDDARAMGLRRIDGDRATMRPTRAWLEGEDLLLRFNVMSGPGQEPLAPGRWRLETTAGTRGPIPVVTTPTLDIAPAATTFDFVRGVYRVTPRVDARDGSFSLDIDTTEGGSAEERMPIMARIRLWGARRVSALRRGVLGVLIRLYRVTTRRNGRRILFTSDSNAALSGNLKLVHDRMVERGLDREYDLLTLFKPSITERRSVRDRFRLPWLMARVDTIVLDDYQPVIYRVDLEPDVRIIQLWHASGPFKTVGYSRIGKPGGPGPWSRVHKNYTRAIVSSDDDVPFYAEAFGIDEDRVIPTGIPRMDRFFDDAARAAGRAAAHEAFPASDGRFTILFAPTFRGDGPRDAHYPVELIDVGALHALAVERDAVVIIKMHPFVREPLAIPEAYVDRVINGSTSSIDVNDLLFAVDLLVTDYSSIVFEYSTLGGPMLFFAPDLEEYVATRDFYIPFEEFVPGRIVRTFDALLAAIRAEDYQHEKVPAFAARHFAHLDGSSTDRVIDDVILAR